MTKSHFRGRFLLKIFSGLVRHRFGTMWASSPTMYRFKIDIFNYALKQGLSLPYDYNSELRITHSEFNYSIPHICTLVFYSAILFDSVLTWGTILFQFKQLGKITLVVYSHTGGNFCNGQACAFKKNTRFFYAVLYNHILGRHTCFSLEKS